MSDSPSNTSGQGCSLSESQRLAYLRAMGIQTWALKSEVNTAPEIVPQPHHAVAAPVNKLAPNATPTAAKSDLSTLDWAALQTVVSQCLQCELHATRTQTVFGVGSQSAELLIVGEAPGVDEDRDGEPFLGRAGKLLDAMLHAIQLNRQQVYIANVLKCRPPQNRDPHISEIICCDGYLQRQIALLQPKLILAAGRIAAQHLLLAREAVGI